MPAEMFPDRPWGPGNIVSPIMIYTLLMAKINLVI
jgi:hypothetical protein